MREPSQASGSSSPKAPPQFLVFHVDGQRYALEVSVAQRVVQAVEVTPLPGAPEAILGTINVHGTIVPVLNLRHRLGARQRPIDIDDQFILARISSGPIVLPADAVAGVIELESGEPPSDGVIEHEDDLLPIQDPESFLSAEEGQLLRASLQAATSPATGGN